MIDSFGIECHILLPDQVFPSFLDNVGLWGRQSSSQNRLRDGLPELIHSYDLSPEDASIHDSGRNISRLHMVYLSDPSRLSWGSLRVAAIREPMRSNTAIVGHGSGERTKLTLNMSLAGLDPSTNEAVIGYIAYELAFQEPISSYLRTGDISLLVGNNVEGLVGTNSSSSITNGRHDLYGWDLVEAMIKRNILPENAFVEGQLNIPVILGHILLGNQTTQW